MKRLALGAVATVAVSLGMAHTVGAATAPQLACGDTLPGPCQETAHFNQINDMNTPAPPGAGCPAFLSADFFTFVGSGNGVVHINLNKDQDAWYTTTFTGSVTITAFLNGTVDQDGNVTSVSDPDPNVLPMTGKITEWFGGSFNNKNMVLHGTVNLSLVNAAGVTLQLHFVSHASWTPGSGQDPQVAFDKVNCS